MPIVSRRCRTCGRRFELLATSRLGPDKKTRVLEYSALDRDELDNLTCPKCDSADIENVPSIGKATILPSAGGVMYPYLDRGLGCVVTSAQHRRRLLKFHPDGTPREHELVPTEGAYDWEAEAERELSSRKDLEREFAEQEARQDADPEIRKAKDRMKEIWDRNSNKPKEHRFDELFEKTDPNRFPSDSY